MSEKAMQKEVVAWMRSKDILHTSTCGGVAYKPHQLRLLYDTGYAKGIPDLFVMEPRGKFHGLFIELKTPKGRLSPFQRSMMRKLSQRHYCVSVAYSAEAAINFIAFYLGVSAEPGQDEPTAQDQSAHSQMAEPDAPCQPEASDLEQAPWPRKTPRTTQTAFSGSRGDE